jgi:hypothetical protein
MKKNKRAAALIAIVSLIPSALPAAEIWGESLAATSDYLIRGISRSNQHAALQADVHVATESGFIGGVFASSVKFDSGDTRNAEVSAFAGFSPPQAGLWRTRMLASYYAYLWNDSGSQYNYAELTFEAAYDNWLGFDVVYSPDAPRYLRAEGLTAVRSTSALCGGGRCRLFGSRGSGRARLRLLERRRRGRLFAVLDFTILRRYGRQRQKTVL